MNFLCVKPRKAWKFGHEVATLKSNPCDLQRGLYSGGQYGWKPAFVCVPFTVAQQTLISEFSVLNCYSLWMHVKYLIKNKDESIFNCVRAAGFESSTFIYRDAEKISWQKQTNRSHEGSMQNARCERL